MARKFGLGAGANALWDDSAPSKQKSEQKKESESSKDFQVSIPQDSQNEKKFPAGVSIGEDGQLFVEIERLRANPEQPRKDFDEEKLEELASSIKEHGVLQAITVEDSGDGFFYIITGERRSRAAKIAGLTKIPAQFRHYDDKNKLEVALIENIQRADLNAVEEARAYQRLLQISGLSQEQIAVRVGKSRTAIANALRLLKLPSDMQDALVSGGISAGHARALLSVRDFHDQRLLFSKIVGQSMSVRKAEQTAADLNSGARKHTQNSAPEVRDPNLTEIEQKFIEAFGTKVSISGKMEKGTIEISYFSKEDLDRLYKIVIKD